MDFNTLLLESRFSIDNIQAMDLWAQGLFVVVVGLIGVFLVLLLFFVTIIVMQKIVEASDLRKAKKAGDSESAS